MREYTVKQINDYIFMLFDNEPFLNNVAVRGEVSNLTYHKSGHIYFDLKDSSGKLSAVMFKSSRSGLNWRMAEGDEVIASGELGVYKRGGSYSLHAKNIERAGRGDLSVQFEELKARLSEMGMFDASYKQPIPRYVRSLGIVTAPTGAAIRDMIRIAKRRNPFIEIMVAPALVQGEGAAASVIDGISRLDGLGLDVIIVGRGGGSMEDLWAFNDEELARAIFNAQTPIVSAVGHETDVTIADFVADLRAATPSEAAELAVFDYAELTERFDRIERGLFTAVNRHIDTAIRRLDLLEEKLLRLSPRVQLERKQRFLEESGRRLAEIMARRLTGEKQRLALCANRLDGLSPARRLAQGYSFLTDARGNRIESCAKLLPGDEIVNYVQDGRIVSSVSSTSKTKEVR